MNSVNLVGRFVKDPELRYTPEGKAVTTFTLAVRNPFKPDEPDYPRCVIWNQGAELVANYCRKGNMIGVEGRISTGSYEGEHGTVWTTEVNVNQVTLIQTAETHINGDNNNSNNSNNDNNANNSNNGNSNNSNTGNRNRGNNNGNRNSNGNGNGNNNNTGNRNNNNRNRNTGNGNQNNRQNP